MTTGTQVATTEPLLDSKTRGNVVIMGSVIAFFGFIVPGLYSVGYGPPKGFHPATVNFSKMPGFDGFAGSGIANGFTGPLDLHITFFAIAASFLLGLFAQTYYIDKGARWLSTVYKPITISSQLISVGQLIWTIGLASAHKGSVPSEIRQRFIADLGGSQSAIQASQYLTVSLGLGFLILFFGFLVGFVGVSPRLGCAVFTIFVVGFIVLLILTRILTGAW